MATKRVEPPLTYGIFTDDNLADAAPGSARRTAVLIAHGMGQQSKFDTLDQVAEGLDPQDAINKVARNVRIGDQSLSRIEMVDFPVEDQRGEVHLYEAYWATLTEGVIKLPEVIAFLKNAAWNGIVNARRPFKRWLFDAYQQPSGGPAGPRTAIYLVLALVVLLSLIFMNSIIVAIASANVLTQLGGAGSKWLRDPEIADDLTLIALMLCAIFGVFSATIFASGKQKARRNSLPIVSRVSFAYFFWVLGATIVSAATMVVSIAYHRSLVTHREWVMKLPIEWIAAGFAVAGILTFAAGAAVLLVAAFTAKSQRGLIALMAFGAVLAAVSLFYAAAHQGGSVYPRTTAASDLATDTAISGGTSAFILLRDFAGPFEKSAFGPYFHFIGWLSERWIGAWALLLFLSNKVRRFLVQYLGDVTIYVTPQSLDRFNEVREKIKDCVLKVASAIYRAKDGDGNFLYDRVIIIGHSLGSVIVYDTLNKLLNMDEYVAGALKVAERTPRLITFGSPLDKTAYLFARNVQRVGQPMRAALAATVQPLIAFAGVRQQIEWKNVWSPLDIIGGELNFYDAPPPPNGKPVTNHVDWSATTPLGAHTEYWEGEMIWDFARAAMFGPAAQPAAQPPVGVAPAGSPQISITIAGAAPPKHQTVQLPRGTSSVDIKWS